AQPFICHFTLSHRTAGTAVRIKGLVDDGAMVNVMDAELWKRIHRRLEPAQASDKTLRMANGAAVRSQGRWRGLFDFQGTQVHSAFEIFPSQGAWSFLIGKPLLEALKATHDYESDQIIVSSGRHKTVITN
ncbi:hypothetical protein GY45DRAFT_1207417, partial [Cubamyces sp. BRFM 1775]